MAITATLLVLGAEGQVIRTTQLSETLSTCEAESKPLYDLVLEPAFGATFDVKLLTIVNSGKAQPGKKITAVVIGNGASVENIRVPHNAKIEGHVVEVQKRDRTHPRARVRLVFDRIKLKHGRTLAFTGAIRYLYAEHIADLQYFVWSPTNPVGYWVRIDDWPDGEYLSQYCYASDTGQGVLITSGKSNIHLGYHTLFTLMAISPRPSTNSPASPGAHD